MTDTLPGLVDEALPDELQIAPPAAPASAGQTLEDIPVSLIQPGPHNPRRDLGDLEGLVASIRAVGILEPLVVERNTSILNVPPYLLLAGHRRLAAAQLAGLAEVPCIVRAAAATPELRMEMALIENLQREGLAPLDEADGYLQLTRLGLSQRVIADRVGCSQSHVSKRLALLELPNGVQKRVEKGTLTLEAAAALTRLTAHPEKLKKAAGEDPSRIVRAVEQAEEEIAWEAKVAELRAIAEGKGWATVDEPANTWDKHDFKILAKWQYQGPELELDVKQHESEPCHAVMIPVRRTYHNSTPSATSVCTDPKRHGPKGASKLKAKVDPKPKSSPADKAWEKEAAERKKAEEQRRAAAAARRAVLAKGVGEHRAPRTTTPAQAHVLHTMLWMAVEWDLHDYVCELLGIAVDAERDEGWALWDYADIGPDELHRAALAVSVVEIEETLRHGSFAGDRVAAHFAYLKTLGYEPNPWEKTKLAEVAKAGEN